MEEWRLIAACRGLGPQWFYEETTPGQDNHGAAGKRVCAECEVQLECLDYAIRVNESYGVWGGVGFDRRNRVRAVFRTGDPIEYERALGAEVEALALTFGNMPDERPITPERQCDRCESTVPAGRHPKDRNGPKATCGRASTYNRGCRCTACVEAKSEYHKRPKKKRRRRSPRGESTAKVASTPTTEKPT